MTDLFSNTHGITPEPLSDLGPRVHIDFRDNNSARIELAAGAFQEIWDEACVVLSTATSIDGEFRPLTDEELDRLEPARRLLAIEHSIGLRQQVALKLAQSMIDVDEIFKEGCYDMFLDETGVIIKEPSETLQAKIAYALKHQKTE